MKSTYIYIYIYILDRTCCLKQQQKRTEEEDCRNLYQFVQMCTNLNKFVQICTKLYKIVQICTNNSTDDEDSTRGWGWAGVEPIISILNSLSRGRDISRAISEREQNSGNDENISLFSCVPCELALQLIHTLMYRYLCDIEDENVDASSSVGYVIGYLLEHFVKIIREEMGNNASSRLFDSWADSADEHMVRRLNDEEVKDVHTLLFDITLRVFNLHCN